MESRDSFHIEIRLIQSCLYFKRNNHGKINYVLFHVDDILMSSNSDEMMMNLFNCMSKEFELKDLGEVKHFLGIEITKDDHGNYQLCQENYIDEIFKISGQQDAKISRFPLDLGYEKIIDQEFLKDNKEYQRLIGMLLYLATNTRPDISASVSILSQKKKMPIKTDPKGHITRY